MTGPKKAGISPPMFPALVMETLGPKYTGIPRVNAQGSWNQTGEACNGPSTTWWSSTWNCALQTPVPQWIQSLVCPVPCIRWSVAVDPLSATAVSLHLTHFAVPFVQIVATVCLQDTWFYTIFNDMCNTRYMVVGPWVDLIHCSLNQSERLPTPPFDWEKLVYSIANQNPGLVRHALSK